MGDHKVEVEVDPQKAQAFMKAVLEDLRALAFMLESRWRFQPTAFAMNGGALDVAYADCWNALKDNFQ